MGRTFRACRQQFPHLWPGDTGGVPNATLDAIGVCYMELPRPACTGPSPSSCAREVKITREDAVGVDGGRRGLHGGVVGDVELDRPRVSAGLFVVGEAGLRTGDVDVGVEEPGPGMHLEQQLGQVDPRAWPVTAADQSRPAPDILGSPAAARSRAMPHGSSCGGVHGSHSDSIVTWVMAYRSASIALIPSDTARACARLG